MEWKNVYLAQSTLQKYYINKNNQHYLTQHTRKKRTIDYCEKKTRHALLSYASIGHPKLKSIREVVTDTVHLYATTGYNT